MIKVYYCKGNASPTDQDRIAPAPLINISPEIYYANDSIIGYTYNITINGYANAMRKENNPSSTIYGADQTINHMGKIRDIFSFNGGDLYIKDNDTNLIVAKGSTIKNIQFNNSNNMWVNYAPFSIEIEFNEIDLLGCSGIAPIGCDGSIFHTPYQTEDIFASDNLLDMKKYKIKQFSDKWSFTIDNQIYQNYGTTFNNIFKVSYELSATGKNYYVLNNLVPAWHQAKAFVQDRLYTQVMGLLNGIGQIKNDNDDGCLSDKSPAELFNIDSVLPRESGLLKDFKTLRDAAGSGIFPTYDIYNENISCTTSESDGSFSVSYNATIKKYDPNLTPVENAALHTYTLNFTTTDSAQNNISMTLQGSVQGLVRGGFIYYQNDYSLPNNGSFLTTVDSMETKYSNALAFYKARVGSETDVLDSIKEDLGITRSSLGIASTGNSPQPASFSLDHSYLEGTIGYNATYDRSTSIGIENGYTSISIVRNDPVDVIQEFVVPGRAAGPIIQKLNMKTPRTISINIEGASDDTKKCEKLSELDFCGDNIISSLKIKDLHHLLNANSKWIKTKEDINTDKTDGSFSISLEYLCKG